MSALAQEDVVALALRGISAGDSVDIERPVDIERAGLRGIQFVYQPEGSLEDDDVGVAPVDPKAFRCVVDSNGLDAVVSAGTLRLHSIGKYPLSETTVALAGSAPWVAVRHKRDHSETEIIVSATEPESNATYLIVPLAAFEFVSTDDGGYYRKTQTCHDGDINIDTPIR